MEIKTQFEANDQIYNAHYVEADPSLNLGDFTLHGVHSICFNGDKIVVVKNSKGDWSPPGGAIEKGETYYEASIREIKEESNMKVLHQEYIGYQDVSWLDIKSRQARMFCIVEPFGNFEEDPDGDISEIKLIDPKDYKEYIKWGEIGDRLIVRAFEMLDNYRKSK
ncbi:MAG: NUDIX hydrolase [Minisyncoccia bacterium]